MEVRKQFAAQVGGEDRWPDVIQAAVFAAVEAAFVVQVQVSLQVMPGSSCAAWCWAALAIRRLTILRAVR